jgi:hypothetical protein
MNFSEKRLCVFSRIGESFHCVTGVAVKLALHWAEIENSQLCKCVTALQFIRQWCPLVSPVAFFQNNHALSRNCTVA